MKNETVQQKSKDLCLVLILFFMHIIQMRWRMSAHGKDDERVIFSLILIMFHIIEEVSTVPKKNLLLSQWKCKNFFWYRLTKNQSIYIKTFISIHFLVYAIWENKRTLKMVKNLIFLKTCLHSTLCLLILIVVNKKATKLNYLNWLVDLYNNWLSWMKTYLKKEIFSLIFVRNTLK